ncbi:hypothetical protein [Kitasatospora sp. KL5]|uniref:hypothetical protein n=1 Tax=Kitasatospora sp. KL5 TaxID=3425125 RepID=UPI003D700EBD
MIPGPHRLKGGALQLGADEHGQPGLFGVWTTGDQAPGTLESTDDQTDTELQP